MEEHAQVIEEVRGLLTQSLVGLVAAGARRLLRLLLDLRADPLGAGAEQLGAVAALGQLVAALDERASERRQRLVRRDGLVLERAIEARAFAGVAGRSGRL